MPRPDTVSHALAHEERADRAEAEVRALKDKLERTQSMLDFLSRDQRPLEVRMADAEAKVRIAERVAAEVVTELRMPIHTRSTPEGWRHSIAAIATGSWDALTETRTEGEG